MSSFKSGQQVRVERDETRWPSRGSWPRYRGKTGTIVLATRQGIIVQLDDPADLSEPDSWFLPHELTPADPQKGSHTPSEAPRSASKASGGSR